MKIAGTVFYEVNDEEAVALMVGTGMTQEDAVALLKKLDAECENED